VGPNPTTDILVSYRQIWAQRCTQREEHGKTPQGGGHATMKAEQSNACRQVIWDGRQPPEAGRGRKGPPREPSENAPL
jgi:hypothetical protein